MLSDVLKWDKLKYEDGRIHWPNIRKHIIDNSCGDGAFLAVIVDFYIHNTLITTRRNKKEIKEMLETYIHGIELDPVEYEKCIKRLDQVAARDGIKDVKWDIRNCDALSCHDFDGKMDFVIANPPYIRTHDLDCDLTGYEFTTEGMKDIYLAFYELGFRMMNETGQMCYITPSSWFTSGAGQKMRDYIDENRNLNYIEDYGHYQLFENATTYVAITRFNKERNNEVEYVTMERTADDDGFWKGSIPVTYEDMMIGGKFYFSVKSQLDKMREISESGKNTKRSERTFQVKNGYATLADDVFIEGDVPWAAGDKYVIPATKASTLKWDWCIFPYDDEGNLVTEKELEKNAPMEYKLLSENKDKLLERATDEPWYAYGRTQAIKDTFKEKWAVKSTIKDLSEPICKRVPPGSGVYGGLYVLTEHPEGLKALETEGFMSYVKMLGKYKSGGYYTFSSKELENYLNWNYGKEKD